VLQSIIDRRLSGKNKSIGNRERFLRRYKVQIREAVKRAVDGRGIRDIEEGTDITLPKRDVSEPVFSHGPGGIRESVHPGNREYVRGDHIPRPQGGAGGSGGSGASPDGTGEDDFVFRITREEFMNYFFDDLALPRLIRTQLLADAPEWKTRARFRLEGNPTSLRGAVDARRAGPADRVGGDAGQVRKLEVPQAAGERPDAPATEMAALKRRSRRWKRG
jgi:uncharacterized sporulation protein YeaH/YhbH (DUF444 family)